MAYRLLSLERRRPLEYFLLKGAFLFFRIVLFNKTKPEHWHSGMESRCAFFALGLHKGDRIGPPCAARNCGKDQVNESLSSSRTGWIIGR